MAFRLISKCQREFLVHWALKSSNENGEPVYYPPVQMKCRWDDRIQQVQMPDNSVVLSRVELITEKPLGPGDYVKRCKLTEVTYKLEPNRNEGSFEVIKIGETPTIKYETRLYEAWA